MAQYPNAVAAFATKNPGDVIPSADWNAITGEITAVEDGLLNGKAPLNSSRSTVASLSVLGNSTLASSITIGTLPYVFPASGGSTGQVLTITSTSGSTMTLGWTNSAPLSNDNGVIFSGSTQTLASGTTYTDLNLKSIDFANNSSLASTANSNFVIQSSGVYLIVGRVSFESNASNQRSARIWKNSTSSLGDVLVQAVNGDDTVLQVSALATLQAADTVGLRAYQTAGGNLGSGNAATRARQNELSIVRVR